MRTQLQEQLRASLWVQPSLGLPPVSQGGAADRFGTPAGGPVWEQVAERVRLAVVDEVSARLGSPAWQTLRRVVERYGPGRYLRHAGAERVSHDDTGTRWRVGVGGERLVVVEVGDRTPAPDGSHRRSWLRVPPWVRTAREAVAGPSAWAPTATGRSSKPNCGGSTSPAGPQRGMGARSTHTL